MIDAGDIARYNDDQGCYQEGIIMGIIRRNGRRLYRMAVDKCVCDGQEIEVEQDTIHVKLDDKRLQRLLKASWND